jgi:hypothetical protein
MKRYSTWLLFVFWSSFGFIAVHSPYVHNNTDQLIEVSLVFTKGKRTFKLAPHAAHCEGQSGVIITDILVRYANGHVRELGRDQLEALRRRKQVNKELWVVQSDSIDLFDLSYARQLKHR